MKASQNGSVESRPSVGLGTDIRLESEDITGFALALDDQILHHAEIGLFVCQVAKRDAGP